MVKEICSKCRIQFQAGESILWCVMGDCPKTQKHWPNEAEVKKYRVGEPFDPNSSNRSML